MKMMTRHLVLARMMAFTVPYLVLAPIVANDTPPRLTAEALSDGEFEQALALLDEADFEALEATDYHKGVSRTRLRIWHGWALMDAWPDEGVSNDR